MTRRRALVAVVLSLACVLAAGLTAAPAENDLQQVLLEIDDMMRGSSSHGTITMRVRTSRFERSLSMESWSQGDDKSLVRIVEPAKERGTATLKVGDKIWNYLPKVDRTIKVPSSMMSASWMGSHFTNDDLVQSSRFSDDYDCRTVAEGAPPPADRWIIDCVPHEDAPVVWGRVRLELDREDRLPRTVGFYDEDDEPARTVTYSDFEVLGGHRLPTRMRAEPADSPGEFTDISYQGLELDIELDEGLFSLQELRR